MSGKSNVVFWLKRRGIASTEALVDAIFAQAKKSDRLLEEREVLAICEACLREAAGHQYPAAA